MALGNGLSFIFDTSKNETPESLARKRALAAAIMGNIGNRPARNAGEGIGNALASIGQGIQVNVLNRRADAAAQAGEASLSSEWNSAFLPPQFPAAPGSPTASDYADTRVKSASGDSAESIKQGLVARGMSPQVADAFVMNFQDESGLNPGINEKAPLVAGSRGGYGLAQWTGPRRRALEAFAAQRGAPVSDTGTQLDFLMSELSGPEKSAWAKIQGANTTGGAAAAIVNNFLRPAESHRASRERRYLANTDPMQVASLDPSIASDLVQRGTPDVGMQPLPNSPASLASISPDQAATPVANAAPPLPAPRTIQDMPVASASQPIQTAQAQPSGPDLSRIPVTAGGSAGVYQPGQGPSLQTLMHLASNPWLNETQRGVIQMMLKQRLDPNAGLDAEYRRAQIKNIESEIAKRNDPNAREKFGNSVIWGQNADGDWVAMQPSSGGGLVPAEVPNGVKLSPPGMSNLNLGTQYGMRDRNGQVINTVPIDNTGKARDTAIGTQQGAQLAAAPGDIVAAQNALDLLDSIRTDPYLDRGTGLSSLGNAIPGTGGYDFANKVQGAKSGGFLTAIQQMRGLGSLSDAEGRAATSAVNRMNTSTSKEEFLSALNDYEKIVKQGLRRAQDRLGGNFTSTPTGKDEGDWNDLGNGVKIRVKP